MQEFVLTVINHTRNSLDAESNEKQAWKNTYNFVLWFLLKFNKKLINTVLNLRKKIMYTVKNSLRCC